MILALIVACEIAFWIVLAAGLVCRYVLRWPRVGAALLICVPLVDLVLLIATVIDLRNGATATAAHGLAAMYIGFSVAFGHSTIRWADRRFAYHFAGGPKPPRAPKYGRERAVYEWRVFGQALIAYAVACALLLIAILAVGDAIRTEALRGTIVSLTWVLAVWAVWAASYTIWPARPGPRVWSKLTAKVRRRSAGSRRDRPS